MPSTARPPRVQPPEGAVVPEEVAEWVGVHRSPMLLDGIPDRLGMRGDEHGAEVNVLVRECELRTHIVPCVPSPRPPAVVWPVQPLGSPRQRR